MRAVVRTHHGNRPGTRAIAFQKQGGHLAHVALRFGRASRKIGFHIVPAQAVTLLRNGKGHHLQRGLAEDLLQAVLAAVEITGFRDGTEDIFLNAAVGFECHNDRQIVIGLAAAIHAFHGDDPAVQQALVEKPLGCHSVQRLKDVACAEMQPCGIFFCPLNHGAAVIGGKKVTLLFPFGTVFQCLVVQLHFAASLSMRSQAPSMYMMPRARS